MSEPKTYKCPECGLHYIDEAIMKQCQDWCRTYKSCNLDITKESIEVRSK